MGTDDGTYEIDEKALGGEATLVWQNDASDEPGATFTVVGRECVIDWSATSIEIEEIDESGRVRRRRIG